VGAWVAAGAAAVALLVAFVLRTRLPAAVTVPLMVAASATLAWGGMLLQDDPSGFEVVLAVVAMAVMGPLHVRIVIGPYGPRG
jgi:hypothetical protein